MIYNFDLSYQGFLFIVFVFYDFLDVIYNLTIRTFKFDIS